MFWYGNRQLIQFCNVCATCHGQLGTQVSGRYDGSDIADVSFKLFDRETRSIAVLEVFKLRRLGQTLIKKLQKVLHIYLI